MPPQLPEESLDRAIVQRLKDFRERRGLALRAFARAANVPASTLRAYELNRAALSWNNFKKFARAYRLNPFWLYSGEGFAMVAYDAERIDPIRAKGRFSKVFAAHLLTPPQAGNVVPGIAAEALRHTMERLAERLSAAAELPHEQQKALLAADGITSALASLYYALVPWLSSALPKPKTGNFFADAFIKVAREHPEFYQPPGEKDSERKELHNAPSGTYSVGMATIVPDLGTLLSQVRNMTLERGSRLALARKLGVTTGRLSEWLSDREDARKPGAEHALKLLQFTKGQLKP